MSSKLSFVGLLALLAYCTAGAQSVLAQAAPAAAPKFSSLPVNPSMKPLDPAVVASNEAAATEDASRARKRSMAYNSVRKVFAGQIPLEDEGKRILDGWYKGYYLPHFTSPEALGELPAMREQLLNKDLRTARSAEAVAYVRSLVLNYMKAFAQSPKKFNFHPAVRHNAMLVIGGLNAVEYGARYPDSKKAFVPDPLPEALDILVGELKSPAQIDAVRLAALVGIYRHATLDLARPANRRMPGDKKKAIVDQMVALLKSTPPAGRTSAGHTWMQRRAIDVLAALGMVGAYADANTIVEGILLDKAAPLSLRCTASEALAKWVPGGRGEVDATAVSKSLGLMAVDAFQNELDRIAALEREEEEMQELRELIKKPNLVASGQLGAAGGSYGGEMQGYGSDDGGYGEGLSSEEAMMSGGDEMYDMGMYGDVPGAPGAAIPADPRLVWSLRRLKYQLTCVRLGLQGMSIASEASPQAQVVAQISKAVDAAYAFTDPPEDKPDLEGMTESIQAGLKELAFLAPQPAALEGGLPPVDLPAEGAAAVPGVDPAVAIDPAEVPADGADGLPLDDAPLPAGLE